MCVVASSINEREMFTSALSHTRWECMYTNGDMDSLVNPMNGFFVSVYEDLPRLQSSHPICDVDEPLPAEFIINVTDTEVALEKVKVNKDGTTFRHGY